MNRTRETSERELVTLQATRELYWFLQGHDPKGGIEVRAKPRLSSAAAFSVIYVLQEKLRLIPDTYERCTRCKDLFDTYTGGQYDAKTGRHYCPNCER